MGRGQCTNFLVHSTHYLVHHKSVMYRWRELTVILPEADLLAEPHRVVIGHHLDVPWDQCGLALLGSGSLLEVTTSSSVVVLEKGLGSPFLLL